MSFFLRFNFNYIGTRALVLLQQGNYEEVKEIASAYEKLLPEDFYENNAETAYFYAKFKLAAGDIDEAKLILKKAVQAREQNALQMRLQGEAKRLLNELEQDN